MKIVGARRPGSKNISRVREISRLAKQRLKWMDHYAAHGNAALTCRYFGISRQTFYRVEGTVQLQGPEELGREEPQAQTAP